MLVHVFDFFRPYSFGSHDAGRYLILPSEKGDQGGPLIAALFQRGKSFSPVGFREQHSILLKWKEPASWQALVLGIDSIGVWAMLAQRDGIFNRLHVPHAPADVFPVVQDQIALRAGLGIASFF